MAFKQVTSASLAEIAGENQDARSVHTLVSRAVRFHEKSAPERTQALRAAAVEALTIGDRQSGRRSEAAQAD